MWKSQNNKKWVKKKRMNAWILYLRDWISSPFCVPYGSWIICDPGPKGKLYHAGAEGEGLVFLGSCEPCSPPGLDFLGVTGLVWISVMSFSPVVYFCSFLYRCFIIRVSALWPPSVCSLTCYSLDSTESICFPLGWTESTQSIMPEIFRAIWLPQCPLLNAVFS